ncbi:MAG: patatin-like phospholipase family protein [Parashewanella sp.]
MLDVYAGKSALQKINQQGFKQQLFTSFLGASGGPKWFCLFGLDKYLFGDFFKGRTSELNLIGSSAGAFRSACFAQHDPVAAITRMAESYSETVYSAKATPAEVTHKAIELLDYMLGENGANEIINNDIFRAHFLVNKVNGTLIHEKSWLQLLGLAKSYILNRIDRRLLGSQYQRYVYRNSKSQVNIIDPCAFTTHYADLTSENLSSALLASGSIPLVMQGIKDIPGSPQGTYRDGGILDYHFDIGIGNGEGLTLYPHFDPTPKAGWFDKKLNRKVSASHYDNIVLLVPSDDFVKSLPYQKIPDRKDFTTMAPETRIRYWKSVLSQTEILAESFDTMLSTNAIERIKVFSP